jgi:coenzyme PQQ biosynthesis protein PqqD
MEAPSKISLASRFSLAPGVRLQTDRITGEPMLLSSEGVLMLNATAQAIVERCDGSASAEAIATALAQEYEADVAELRTDVLECLENLHSRRLLLRVP